MLDTLTEISLDPHLREQLKEDWIYPLLIFIWFFCVAHALSILQLTEYSSFKETCLSAAYLMTPFIFFLLCRTADIIGAECLLSCIQVQKENHHQLEHLSFSRSMGAGVMFFWLVFIPLHRFLSERIRTLKG
jgi:hypothetical protein